MLSLLLQLNEDLLGEILTYGDLRTLHSLPIVHRSLIVSVRSNGYLWQVLTERDWGLRAEDLQPHISSNASVMTSATNEMKDDSDELDWFSIYRQHTIQYGRTSKYFLRLRSIWKRVEAWLSVNAAQLPPITASLAPPDLATIADVDALVGQIQTNWKLAQVAARRTYLHEIEKEAAREMDGKRQSKREKNSNHGTPSPSPTGSSVDEDMKSSSSSSTVSSDVPMDFETAVGLPRPTTEQDQIASKKLADFHIPEDFLCSVLMHNGQIDVTTREQLFTGLFGGYSFYSFFTNFRLVPVHTMLDGAVTAASMAMQEKVQEARLRRRANKRRKSTSSSHPTNTSDLQSTPTAAAISTAATSSTTPNTSLTDANEIFDDIPFLIPVLLSPIGEQPVCFFFTREGRIIRRYQDGTPHPIANSFIELMEAHITDLENGMFAFNARTGINRFPLKDELGSVTVTNGIRIQVATLFVPEQSTANQWFFSYHVRITHDGSVPTRVTLTTRHWVIEDATGKVSTVDGPGVIGFFPQIYPDCPLFTYESCCPIPTPTGKMHGSFRFKDDHTGEEFDAMISPFIFDAKRNYC